MDKFKPMVTPIGSGIWCSVTRPAEYEGKPTKYHVVNIKLHKDTCSEYINELERMNDVAFNEYLKGLKPVQRKKAQKKEVFAIDMDPETGEETGFVRQRFSDFTHHVDGNRKPVIMFDAKRNPVYPPVEITNGSVIRVAFVPKFSETKGGGSGLTFNLRKVQLIELNDYGISSAAEFDEEDGYVHGQVEAAVNQEMKPMHDKYNDPDVEDEDEDVPF